MDFVQILNLNINHWITVLHLVVKGVADVMQSSHKKIIVNYCDVQWQTEGWDCGLFVINFATSLCSDQNYTSLSPRLHLLKCLENKVLQIIPNTLTPKE